MKLEARVFVTPDQKFSYDIVDLDDATTVGDDVFPELILTGRDYAQEQTAERHAADSIVRLSKASEADFRKLAGYDPKSKCGFPRVREGFRALRRVGS